MDKFVAFLFCLVAGATVVASFSDFSDEHFSEFFFYEFYIELESVFIFIQNYVYLKLCYYVLAH